MGRKIEKRFKILQDAKTLFEIALDADQHIILSAVERYVRNVAKDVRDLATHINENDKRLLDLDEYTREQSEKAKTQHKNTGDSLYGIGRDVTDHRCEWRSEVKKKDKGKKSLTLSNRRIYQIDYKILTSRLDEIVRWLSSTDPTINQNATCESHEPQTGSWFVHGNEYPHWKETPQSFLWVHGIAGCGKTVLSSTIIQDLIDYCNTPHYTVDNKFEPHSVAYFYCSFTDIEKQNPRNLISSLLAQLVRNLPDITNSLSQLHGRYREKKLPIKDMKVELQSVLKLSGQAFLVIDDLDECPIDDEDKSRTKVLALLAEFSTWALPNLHVLVTSRREPDIVKALASLVNFSSISIQTDQIQPDIHKCIKSQLANDLELKVIECD